MKQIKINFSSKLKAFLASRLASLESQQSGKQHEIDNFAMRFQQQGAPIQSKAREPNLTKNKYAMILDCVEKKGLQFSPWWREENSD
jgi:hypothetical protein